MRDREPQGEPPDLLEELQSLKAWRREAEGLLREVEWRGEAGHWDEGGCPMCRGPEPFGEGKKYGGHEKDCRLRAFLGEGTKDHER